MSFWAAWPRGDLIGRDYTSIINIVLTGRNITDLGALQLSTITIQVDVTKEYQKRGSDSSRKNTVTHSSCDFAFEFSLNCKSTYSTAFSHRNKKQKSWL